MSEDLPEDFFNNVGEENPTPFEIAFSTKSLTESNVKAFQVVQTVLHDAFTILDNKVGRFSFLVENDGETFKCIIQIVEIMDDSYKKEDVLKIVNYYLIKNISTLQDEVSAVKASLI